MKKRTKLPEDPVVEEVRSVRQALWQEAGGTVAGLIRIIERRTKQRRKPGRSATERAAGRRRPRRSTQ